MRNLTIERRKTFVASLITMKVYIEDALSQELIINNVPCRKLGEIKNGEQQNYIIDDQQRKVFVIADKLSKGYCNDFYVIPAGQVNVFLTGQNKFDLASGNAFRFDNNNNPEAVASRKKSGVMGIIVLILSFIFGYLLATVFIP